MLGCVRNERLSGATTMVAAQHDANVGYSITLWDTETDMRAFWDSPKRKEVMAPLEPIYVNQFTTTHCQVTYTLHG